MDRLKEIEVRKQEIRTELENLDDTSKIEELDKEVDALNIEEKSIKEAQAKEIIAKKLEENSAIAIEIPLDKEEEKNMEEKNILSSAEYRSAYLKTLMGKELNEVEARTMTTTSAKGVPTTTANKIVAALRDVSPVINDIDLYYGNGYLKVFVKTTLGDATEAQEGAALTPEDFVLVPVELTPARITEFMRISGSLDDMSIDDFEDKMIEDITGGLAKKIENKIYAVMNSVETAIEGQVTEANVFSLYGKLKSSYAKKAKFFMNRATKAQVMAVSNKSKNDLYANNAILGSPVEETDCLADGVIIYGNAKFIVGELSKAITIEDQRVLNNDTHDWLGVTMFDTKMGIADAFKKLAPATTEPETTE